MKIAILHDWLNQKVGGAESVLIKLSKMYPDADIYTIVYNKKKFEGLLDEKRIKTSHLQKMPSFIKRRPKLLLPFIKKAIQKWDLSEYDLVISSSSAWVKNANIPNSVRHVCYCYSPARMLWDSWPKYMYDLKIGSLGRLYVTSLASRLRLWDYYQSQNSIEFIAISEHVKNRITKFYHKDSKVIYPPVSMPTHTDNENQKRDYYLIISVLSKYKNIELAVRAFKDSGKNLVIAGDGPDIKRLKKIAEGFENIIFLGRVDNSHKDKLLKEAKAFIFCNIEDFGITMVESISLGTGVIALRGGGAQEIVIENKTGIFYDNTNEESLNRAIVKYEKSIDFKSVNGGYARSKFSEEKFEEHFRGVIDAK
jgi:glycosyltransferase involved in cell wall biosynthesis